MRYYLITKDITTSLDPLQILSDRTTNIVHIQPLAEKFSIQMINRFFQSVSSELKLNNSDKERLDNNGLSLVYQYPKNQLWIYDIEHPDNSFLKNLVRDARIDDLLNLS